MTDLASVEIVDGEYKGKAGKLTGMFWASNVAIVVTNGGKELVVNPCDIAKMNF